MDRPEDVQGRAERRADGARRTLRAGRSAGAAENAPPRSGARPRTAEPRWAFWTQPANSFRCLGITRIGTVGLRPFDTRGDGARRRGQLSPVHAALRIRRVALVRSPLSPIRRSGALP